MHNPPSALSFPATAGASDLRRRQVLAGALGLLAGTARAADARVRRIGYLTSATNASQREEDLRAGLRTLGWVEGDNLRIEYRRAGNNTARLTESARDLVAQRVEMIVASTTTAVLAARQASTTLPIVTISADPLANGFAESLRRPGGNVTGISTLSPALSGKRLELLREMQPALRHATFLGYAPDPTHRQFLAETQRAAQLLGVRITAILLEAPDQLTQALAQLAQQRPQAVLVQPLLPIMGLGKPIAHFALEQGLATCTDGPAFVADGGLLSYGYDPAVADRRVAIYVDRVLKGAQPAVMPIETPQKFLLALNQATARKLGLATAATVRLRAERLLG